MHMGRNEYVKKLLIAGVVAVTLVVASGAWANLSVGGKVWYADVDGTKSAEPLYGPIASLDMGDFWVSGMFLFGQYDIAGLPAGVDASVDTKDAEAVLGYTWKILDIGAGARYSVWTAKAANDFGQSAQGDLAQWGPMVYAGLGDSFGKTPLGWYVAGSWMFYDLGDARDAKNESGGDAETFEHWNAEGGLFLHWQHLSATLGYRYKQYINISDLKFQGPAASASFVF